METKHEWKHGDYHPLQQCFFCKKRTAVTIDHEELYKVIRNTTGFPGYVVNYTRVLIPIPICSQCSAVHHEEDKQMGVLKVIAWAIATGVICYWMYDPADGLIVCLTFSMLIAIPLSLVPLFVMAVIWDLCSKKTDEIASKRDYPVVKRLLSLGWQWKMPKAKYGKRKNETIEKEAIDRLNVEHQLEAMGVISDFLLWCTAERSQNKPMQAALDGAPDG